MKKVEIHGRKIEVPDDAKYLWQTKEGMCYWSVELPEANGEYWKFPPGEFGIIHFPMLIKEV